MKKPETICIIDDDLIFQFIVKRQIESIISGDLIFFSDGEQAVDFFKKFSKSPEKLPDIILLDLNMPVMDGWDFLEEFQRIRPSIRKNISIYIVSSSPNKTDIERAKNLPEISDYIVKPLNDKILRDLVIKAA